MNRTPSSSHDVVVVGARAAGAATAMLLARAGLDVLVVDRSRYGADTLSTHALMRAGVEVDDHRIGGLGLSVGGALHLHEAAQNDALRAVLFGVGHAPPTGPLGMAMFLAGVVWLELRPGTQVQYAPLAARA